MTPQQVALYRHLWERRNDPVSPTYDEMRRFLGLASKSGVLRILTALVRMGYVARIPGRARTVHITGKLPPGFVPTLALTTRQHQMWAVKTRTDAHGEIIQPLSCRFSPTEAETWQREHYANRAAIESSVVPVIVTIEEKK